MTFEIGTYNREMGSHFREVGSTNLIILKVYSPEETDYWNQNFYVTVSDEKNKYQIHHLCSEMQDPEYNVFKNCLFVEVNKVYNES